MKLHVTDRFAKALDKLSTVQREQVRDALTKLVTDPVPPGLKLKKLQGLGNVYSARVNRGDRIIMLKVEDGFELHDVGTHDLYRHQSRKMR